MDWNLTAWNGMDWSVGMDDCIYIFIHCIDRMYGFG